MNKQFFSAAKPSITFFADQGVLSFRLFALAVFMQLTLLTAFSPGVHGKTGVEEITVVILGDSLSAAYGIPKEASWVHLIDASLDTSHPMVRIINTSISGETTGGGKNRLPQILEQYEPEIVVIELGGNDGLRGFPIRIIRNNLEKMIKQALDQGSEVLLLGMKIPPNYGVQYTQQFFEAYQTLAEKYDLAIVPFLLEGIALGNDMMQSDGIHPTAKAQPLIKHLVLPELLPLIEKVKQGEQISPDS